MSKHWDVKRTSIIQNLIIDKNIDTYELRILLLMMSLDFFESKALSISHIESILGISRAKTSISLRKLAKNGYICKTRNEVMETGKAAEYTISINIKMNRGY